MGHDGELPPILPPPPNPAPDETEHQEAEVRDLKASLEDRGYTITINNELSPILPVIRRPDDERGPAEKTTET
jgi:hypothetical protein